MSYQVLARKWRPSQFNEVVGQTHVLEPLRHALENNRLHHAYLFTGTRGVGKTTIARILAKALNCEQGVSATPCGTCQSCREINEGRFVDLLEIDAASRTKVEDTRELLDNVQYRPSQGRFKVYLIDEVHMLSRHSFNALLKTLEEPPEHVKFLLATTDPQKLPITVVSRCLQFNLRALTPDLITQQLQTVLSAETIDYDAEALPLLARAARGSMRDGLSLTDQAIAQGSGAVNLQSVQQMLGNVPRADMIGLLSKIAANDANGAFALLDEMAALVPDIGMVLAELQALLHRLALVQQLPELATDEEQQGGFKQLLRQLPAEVIQLYYRLVLEGRKELPHSVDDRSGVEMTLLRLLAFRPVDGLTVDATINETGERATATPSAVSSDAVAEVTPEPPPPARPSPSASPTAASTPPTPDTPPETEVAGDLSDLLQMREQLRSADRGQTDGEKKNDIEPATVEATSVTDTPVASPQASSPVTTTVSDPETVQNQPELTSLLPQLTPDIRLAEQVDDWSALIAAMDISGLGRQLLLNSNLLKVADNHWLINVAPAQQSLLSDATAESVRLALQQSLAAQGKFEFRVEEPRVPTPLMIQQHIDAYRHQLAVEWVQNDAAVLELKQRFAAEVDESTIKAV